MNITSWNKVIDIITRNGGNSRFVLFAVLAYIEDCREGESYFSLSPIQLEEMRRGLSGLTWD
ncbi:hypothetical protein [Ammoniphilus sp. 3BR4]|uniref:hypothetical protein n=1 Tax=Ammoniphilus sp. 3BR4 TaxID=3158265 RepID=UPI003465D471